MCYIWVYREKGDLLGCTGEKLLEAAAGSRLEGTRFGRGGIKIIALFTKPSKYFQASLTVLCCRYSILLWFHFF